MTSISKYSWVKPSVLEGDEWEPAQIKEVEALVEGDFDKGSAIIYVAGLILAKKQEKEE
tara:strand:- start:703 stop:879 length:177 start_codon:yes stop_codon:yes gene_type:complete